MANIYQKIRKIYPRVGDQSKKSPKYNPETVNYYEFENFQERTQ